MSKYAKSDYLLSLGLWLCCLGSLYNDSVMFWSIFSIPFIFTAMWILHNLYMGDKWNLGMIY